MVHFYYVFFYDFLHEKIITSLIIINYSFFDSCKITYFQIKLKINLSIFAK